MLSFKIDPSKKLATWALVLGIINLFTFGILGVGTLVGLTLGIVALVKATHDRERYAGKGLAIAGLVMSSISLATSILGIASIVVFNNLQTLQRAKNDRKAMIMLHQIYGAQEGYKKKFGRGNYTTKLSDLTQPEVNSPIDYSLATAQTNPIYGYIYSDMRIGLASEGNEPRFSITCRPADIGWFYPSGNNSYYIDESGIIRHSGSPTVTPDANSAPVY